MTEHWLTLNDWDSDGVPKRVRCHVPMDDVTVDFARTVAEGGRFDGIIDLTRLTNGAVMCCICFEYVPLGQLWQDPAGETWDMCQPCGEVEGVPQCASS